MQIFQTDHIIGFGLLINILEVPLCPEKTIRRHVNVILLNENFFRRIFTGGWFGNNAFYSILRRSSVSLTKFLYKQ